MGFAQGVRPLPQIVSPLQGRAAHTIRESQASALIMPVVSFGETQNPCSLFPQFAPVQSRFPFLSCVHGFLINYPLLDSCATNPVDDSRAFSAISSLARPA